MTERSDKPIFSAPSLRPDQATNFHLRAQLMLEVEALLKAPNMPQVDVAALFGVSQLRVSNLLKSRIDLVTAHTLINQLSRLGRGFDLVVTDRGSSLHSE